MQLPIPAPRVITLRAQLDGSVQVRCGREVLATIEPSSSAIRIRVGQQSGDAIQAASAEGFSLLCTGEPFTFTIQFGEGEQP